MTWFAARRARSAVVFAVMRRAVARREYMDNFMLTDGQYGMRDYFSKQQRRTKEAISFEILNKTFLSVLKQQLIFDDLIIGN